jgi:hypothetical protein
MNLPADLFAVPFRMQPGLRRMAVGARHFTPLMGGERAFVEKLTVLSSEGNDGLLHTPGFDFLPALRAVARTLAHEWPQSFVLRGSVLDLCSLGVTVSLDDGACCISAATPPDVARLLAHTPQAAWAAVALSVADDMAVLRAPQGQLDLIAVCLPSHWEPAVKIGKPFVQVHAPVADNALLLQAAQGLMRLVTADSADRWERYVWTITPSPLLDAHPKRYPKQWPDASDVQAFARGLHFRLERQTFVPLSEHGQAVFTIHVQMEPLSTALTAQEHGLLHASLASMSDAVLDYRGFTAVRLPLLAAIEAVQKTK